MKLKTMKEKERLFLKGLSKLLKDHNACLSLDSVFYGNYGCSKAELTFDLIDPGLSYSNIIKHTDRQDDITFEDIDKLIETEYNE